jgi:hypothetical protein
MEATISLNVKENLQLSPYFMRSTIDDDDNDDGDDEYSNTSANNILIGIKQAGFYLFDFSRNI